MPTFYKLILVSFCSILTFNSYAETGFISDNIYTYIHKGPSAKFKISGSINAGSKVEILERSENGDYTKIIDIKGREGWVMTKFTSLKPSVKQRYLELQSELTKQIELNKELTSQTQSHSSQTEALSDLHKNKIDQLNNNIIELTADLSKSNADFSLIKAQLKGEDEDIKIKWLTRGGLLVLISFLIGIFVSSMISKKKKKSSW